MDRTAPDGEADALVILKVGGAVLGLESGDRGWLAAAATRFRGFESGERPEWALRYEVSSGGDAGVPGSGLVREDDAAGFTLRGPGFAARIDLRSRAVRIDGPPWIGALDAVLRYVLPSIVADGLVLHGIGVEDGERAWACAGPSGSGKSTLAGLAGERAVCDELVAVRLVDGAWHLDALPFWSARPTLLALSGVSLLRHGPRQERSRLGEAAALRAVGANVLWPTYSPGEMGHRFGLLAGLVERVPVFDLAFAPTPDVLQELTRDVT